MVEKVERNVFLSSFFLQPQRGDNENMVGEGLKILGGSYHTSYDSMNALTTLHAWWQPLLKTLC